MCFRPGSFCFRTVSHQNICKSVCGNSNLHFITLDPSLLSHKCQHMMGKILWWKCIHWGKSLKTQFLKFFSFLRRVSIESPTASKMSQAKTISHKVFPIPHYLTTWPPDYLTIWLFDDYLTIWSPDGASYSRVRREGRLIILVTDWPLAYSATNIIFVPCVFLHFWTFDSLDDWLTDPPSSSVTQEFSNYCDDWRHKVCTWLSFVLKDESANDVGGCKDIWNSNIRASISWLLSKLMLTIFNEFCCTFRSNWRKH